MPMLLLSLAAAFGCLAMALFVTSEWPWMLFGFIGLVPWLAALERARSLRWALGAGSLMSVAYVFGVGYWIPSMIEAFTGLPWALALLVTVLGAPLIQPQFVAYALVRRWAMPAGRILGLPTAPLAAAFAFVAVDWGFPKVFSDTLGDNLMGAVWMRQAADLVGALGLGCIVLLVNECVLGLWKGWCERGRAGGLGSMRAPALALLLLTGLPTAYGAIRYHQLLGAEGDRPELRFAMVQAGFSHFTQLAEHYGAYLTVRTVLDSHVAMSRQAIAAQPLDLVIWPENVYPLSFGTPFDEEADRLDQRIRELVARTGVPLLFGARDREGEDWFNAAFLVQPSADGEPAAQTYRKASLFPFVERTPVWLGNRFFRLRAEWMGTFTPGPGPASFDLDLAGGGSLRVVPLVCYDALFPGHVIRGVRQGGEVLLTLSNDSWFEYGRTPQIILNGSAMRSVETRRPQLRATVTGISAVITPAGDIVDRLDTGEYGVLVGVIPAAGGTSLMLLWGSWFGPFSLAAALLILLLARRRRGQGAVMEAANR